MATSAEQTFIRAVAAAEGTRQASKAAAFATFAAAGFAFSAQAAYAASLAAADQTYAGAVSSAATTAGVIGGGGLLGNAGQSGPIGGTSASIVAMN